MFERWRAKRDLKRIQAQYPHDWHELRSFRVDVTGRYSRSMEYEHYHDVFCPICEKTVYGISEAEMTRIEQKRRIRRLYKRSQNGEFRKGDYVTCRD